MASPDVLTIESTDLYDRLARWLEDRIDDAFPTLGGVYFENQRIDRPTFNASDTVASSWVLIEVRETISRQMDIGTSNPWFQADGNLHIHCRTPLDIGSGQAREIADVVSNILRRSEHSIGVSGISLRAPSLRTTAMPEWFQVMVTCPFQARARKY